MVEPSAFLAPEAAHQLAEADGVGVTFESERPAHHVHEHLDLRPAEKGQMAVEDLGRRLRALHSPRNQNATGVRDRQPRRSSSSPPRERAVAGWVR